MKHPLLLLTLCIGLAEAVAASMPAGMLINGHGERSIGPTAQRDRIAARRAHADADRQIAEYLDHCHAEGGEATFGDPATRVWRADNNSYRARIAVRAGCD